MPNQIFPSVCLKISKSNWLQFIRAFNKAHALARATTETNNRGSLSSSRRATLLHCYSKLIVRSQWPTDNQSNRIYPAIKSCGITPKQILPLHITQFTRLSFNKQKAQACKVVLEQMIGFFFWYYLSGKVDSTRFRVSSQKKQIFSCLCTAQKRVKSFPVILHFSGDRMIDIPRKSQRVSNEHASSDCNHPLNR